MTPFSAELDLLVAKMSFYRNWAGIEDGEHGFYSTAFFDFIYLYGVLPSQIICAIAGICLILSKWMPNLKRFRGACSVMSLTLFFGSLLITHTLLKECWGRPRPRQIIEFGGHQSFRAYYQPLFKSAPEPSKSFPSGHSTCGFYFFCFYFLGRRFNSRSLATFGLTTGLLLGTMLSIARIVQGGHFISDVYISALIMWLTAYYCDYLVFEAPFLSKLRKAFLETESTPCLSSPA
jgi:lipid A 4'-phosphatase